MTSRLEQLVDEVAPLSRRKIPDLAVADASVVACALCGALTLGRPCSTPHDRYRPDEVPDRVLSTDLATDDPKD